MTRSHNIVQGAATKGWDDVPPLHGYRRPGRRPAMMLDPEALTPEQRRFLIFHAEDPWPHRWAWRGVDWAAFAAGRDPGGRLTAWKHSSPGGWQRRCMISRAGLGSIPEAWWEGPFRVSEAGRLALGIRPCTSATSSTTFGEVGASPSLNTAS